MTEIGTPWGQRAVLSTAPFTVDCVGTAPHAELANDPHTLALIGFLDEPEAVRAGGAFSTTMPAASALGSSTVGLQSYFLVARKPVRNTLEKRLQGKKAPVRLYLHAPACRSDLHVEFESMYLGNP